MGDIISRSPDNTQVTLVNKQHTGVLAKGEQLHIQMFGENYLYFVLLGLTKLCWEQIQSHEALEN